MSASAPSTPPVVPCLAQLYLALGADDPPAEPPATPLTHRVVAAAAAILLALSVAIWPAAPIASAEWLSTAGVERPAGTLPEHVDLVPGDAGAE